MSTSPVTPTPCGSGNDKPPRERYLEAEVKNLEHLLDHLKAETREQIRTIEILRGEKMYLRSLLLALSAKTGEDWVELEGQRSFDGSGIEIEFSTGLLGQTQIVRWRWYSR